MRTILFVVFQLIAIAGFSQVRERMLYSAKYGFVKGGESELIVSDTLYNDMPLTHYYARGYSTGLTKMLYDINNIYETIMDDEEMIPYFHIRNVKENRYRFYNETNFYCDADSICSTRSGCREVPSGMIDALTLYAMMRSEMFIDTLKKGDMFVQDIYHADKHFKMTSTYDGKKTIKTKLGMKECHVISPIIEDSKLVAGSDALKFYITNDSDRIPVIIELEMTIGKVSGAIESYTKYDNKQIDNK